ncbi:MAG: desulfoferrodoxin family protein [Eubacteriales bacterium]|nr:desulfoferrodoxin family protein [Eubacteriales bacterium]
MKFYICKHCGNIIEKINDSGAPVSCCGEQMTELIPGTSDGASEKHVPIFDINENAITVKVGTLKHPMEEVHYIEWLEIETEKGVQRKYLKPGEEPQATFLLTEDDTLVSIYAYCNLHGLWKAE